MEKKKKSSFKHDLGVQKTFYYYLRKYPNRLDSKQFSQILNMFNNKLIEEIYKRAYITMPYSLGDLFIIKYKPKLKFDDEGNLDMKNKFKVVDYKTTNELWEKHPELKNKQWVYYDNFHTDGYKFRIKWKRYHTIREHRLYNFTPSRQFSRGLAKYLKENPNQSYYGK